MTKKSEKIAKEILISLSDNLKFKQTSCMCPEQYDVFYDGKKVAYVRLRWGNLTVNYPDVSGKEIYYYHFRDDMKGSFDDYEEREKFMKIIKKKIINKLNRRKNEK